MIEMANPTRITSRFVRHVNYVDKLIVTSIDVLYFYDYELRDDRWDFNTLFELQRDYGWIDDIVVLIPGVSSADLLRTNYAKPLEAFARQMHGLDVHYFIPSTANERSTPTLRRVKEYRTKNVDKIRNAKLSFITTEAARYVGVSDLFSANLSGAWRQYWQMYCAYELISGDRNGYTHDVHKMFRKGLRNRYDNKSNYALVMDDIHTPPAMYRIGPMD